MFDWQFYLTSFGEIIFSLFALLYVFFALLMARQVQELSKLVHTSSTSLVKTLSLSYVIFAISIFVVSLIALMGVLLRV